MASSRFSKRPLLTERIELQITEYQKRLAFEAAARQGVSTAHFIRNAIDKETRAQEVAKSNPRAVIGDRSGNLKVDYREVLAKAIRETSKRRAA